MFITGKLSGDPAGIYRAWPERLITMVCYEESRSAAGDTFKLTVELEGFADPIVLEGNDAKGGWDKIRQSH